MIQTQYILQTIARNQPHLLSHCQTTELRRLDCRRSDVLLTFFLSDFCRFKKSKAFSPCMTIWSTNVLNDVQCKHCVPRKCHARFVSVNPQSIHIVFTTRAKLGGTGCISILAAIASQVGAIRSAVSAVFLQSGQRKSCSASSRKQSQCMVCPQGISWEARRLLNKYSWQTGQSEWYRSGLQWCWLYRDRSIQIPQSWQCWKFSLPPIRQNPQSEQWYGWSSPDIHRLHSMQWYSPNWTLHEMQTLVLLLCRWWHFRHIISTTAWRSIWWWFSSGTLFGLLVFISALLLKLVGKDELRKKCFVFLGAIFGGLRLAKKHISMNESVRYSSCH